MLWSTLERLGTPQREVLRLYYLGNLSVRDIASTLALTSATVKQRLYRGRRRLRKLLTEEGVGNERMAEEFAERVVAKALERGRQLLNAQRWVEAKVEYRQVTVQVVEHAEAQKGLALALTGLYGGLDRHGERYALLRAYGDEAAIDKERAKAWIEAGRSAQVLGDYEDILAQHARVKALKALAPAELLASYYSLVEIYAKQGMGEVWLAETEKLHGPLATPVAEASFYYAHYRMDLLRKCGHLHEAVAWGDELLAALVGSGEKAWVWRSDTLGLLLQLHGECGDEGRMRAVLKAVSILLDEVEPQKKGSVK